MARKTEKNGYNDLEIAAILLAVLLSFACLVRGAVQDISIAILLLLCLPILSLALKSSRSLHPELKYISVAITSILLLLLLLQQFPPFSGGAGIDLWQQTAEVIGKEIRPTILQDKAGWLQGLGRWFFYVMVTATALCIGSSESSARLFLQSLLATGAALLAVTFFMTTAKGIPSLPHEYYSHGFVNANNAATYMGVMLLLALMQATRLLRRPSQPIQKVWLEMVDQLQISSIIKGFLLLFGLLVSLAGLFMTGSRGGILFSLLAVCFFGKLVLSKANVSSMTRFSIIMGTIVVILALFIWSFLNFGQGFLRTLEREGFDPDMRFEMYGGTVEMARSHPLFGSGLGSFSGVFQQFRPATVTSDGVIEKAHNTYLELAAEMGIPALLLMVGLQCALGWVLYRGVKERKERYLIPALGLALWLLVTLHSLIDFPMQIPGLAALFLALIIVCASQTDARFSEPASHSAARTSSNSNRVRIRKRKEKQQKSIA